MQKLLWCLILSAPMVWAQKHELGLTLGGIVPQDRGSAPNSLRLTGGVALQANYGYRFWSNDRFAVLGEFHFLANGQRKVEDAPAAATRDVATLYATPGIRVKFAPKSAIAPYVAVGGGYALYEQSFFRVDGRSNEAPRFRHGGAFVYGGGVDVRVPEGIPLSRFIGLRGEIRDFVSGNPAYNLPQISGAQHNVVVGGGFVIKWGE